MKNYLRHLIYVTINITKERKTTFFVVGYRRPVEIDVKLGETAIL